TPRRRRGVEPCGRLGHDLVLQRRTSAPEVGRCGPAGGVQRPVRLSDRSITGLSTRLRPSIKRQRRREEDPMSTQPLTRRSLLLGTAGLGAGAVLTGCVGSGGSEEPTTDTATGSGSAPTGDPDGPVTLQNSQSDPAPKEAVEQIVADYDGDVTLNTVAL